MRTSVWVSTASTRGDYNPFNPIGAIDEWLTTATMTLVEPTGIIDFPATVTQTIFIDKSVTLRRTRVEDKSVYISSDITTGIQHSTWVLRQPRPTDLPAGTSQEKLPCSECASGAAAPDARCAALGLTTSCQGQCRLRDGIWWCLRMKYMDVGTDAQMGRVCWGNSSTYMQLLEPCVEGDHALGCVPCQGKDVTYSPNTWIWP
jgi:hypothetical protein